MPYWELALLGFCAVVLTFFVIVVTVGLREGPVISIAEAARMIARAEGKTTVQRHQKRIARERELMALVKEGDIEVEDDRPLFSKRPFRIEGRASDELFVSRRVLRAAAAKQGWCLPTRRRPRGGKR